MSPEKSVKEWIGFITFVEKGIANVICNGVRHPATKLTAK
jgi:hypothetical protein